MTVNQFEANRPLMFAIAYRMLGSAMEAEDIVQEAYLRYQAVPQDSIQSHKALLSTIVTRLCLDHLKSARVQRETYIGPWLPEPVLTGADDQRALPSRRLSDYESISMAFLVLLESLNPAERAVFLLREVFDYPYDEIAEIIGRSAATCRQLFSRAKKHIEAHRPRFKSSREEHTQILNHFIQAVEGGNLEALQGLLAEDVVSWSDGGGKVHAATRPVYGRDAVARFLIGVRRLAGDDYHATTAEVNGLPALIVRGQDGRAVVVLTLEVRDDKITVFRIVGNPDKLTGL